MALRTIHLGPIENYVMWDDVTLPFYQDGVTPIGLIVPIQPAVDNAVVRKVDLGSSAVNPLVDLQYVVMAFSSVVPNERKLTAGTGVGLADGGAGGNATISIGQPVETTSDVTFDDITATGHVTVDADNKALRLGADQDATILYDGTNLLIDPKAVGSGRAEVQGDLKVTSNLNIGVTTPTARLHIAAGSTGAGTAPLKLTTQGSGLTSVEQGVFELIGNSLQFTQLAKRRGVSMGQNVRISSTTVENTTSESAALITAEHGANYLEIGKMEEIVLYGTIEQRSNPNAQLTVRVKYAGSTIHTFVTPASQLIATGTVFKLQVITTCRATGGTGTLQIDSSFVVRGILDTGNSSSSTIDTTTAQDTTVTVQWGEADASDIFIATQGRVLCIDTSK